MTACVFSKQALYAFVSNAYLFWFSMGEKKQSLHPSLQLKEWLIDKESPARQQRREQVLKCLTLWRWWRSLLFLHVAKCLTCFASGTRSWYFPTQWFVLMWLTWKNLYKCEFIQKIKLNYRSPGESKFEVIGDATKYFYFTSPSDYFGHFLCNGVVINMFLVTAESWERITVFLHMRWNRYLWCYIMTCRN